MNRTYILILMLFGTLFLVYCSSTKKAAAPAPAVHLLSYETDVKSLIESKCTPCHLPAKGGNKAPFDTYERTKDFIDPILTRIQLNPGEKGFMPMKHPKLSDSAINVFKQWKTDGLLKSK